MNIKLKQYKDYDFSFSKKFGQNFISDTNFLNSLVKLTGISKQDDVLEIGAGAGALTKVLTNYANKVISYEIDESLKSILEENLKDVSNVKVIFADALKTDLHSIENNFTNNYSIVANIPYYITSPLIFKFLENSKRVNSMSLMVQKEVAERIVAIPGSKNYGLLSVAIAFYGSAKILKIVSSKMFRPIPKVDSAFVKISIEQNKYEIDSSLFFKVIKSAFANRRKTIVNNLNMSFNIDKNTLENLMNSIALDIKSRAENLCIEEFVCLTKLLEENNFIK